MPSNIQHYPPNVIELIKTSKFAHLATCSNDSIPSLSLMNYLYIPRELSYFPNDKNDYIIFATKENTVKYDNILSNPNISLLFHDWISINNSILNKQSINNPTSSTNVNTNNNITHIINRYPIDDIHDQMSATIKGKAEIVSPLTKEAFYYKQLLLKGNPEAEVFILGNATAIVKVEILACKVVDINNNISLY